MGQKHATNDNARLAAKAEIDHDMYNMAQYAKKELANE